MFPNEVEWHDQIAPMTLLDLSRVTKLSADDINVLVEYGAIVPVDVGDGDIHFQVSSVALIRKAANLCRTFDLELFAMVVFLDHLRRIECLEEHVRALELEIQFAKSGK